MRQLKTRSHCSPGHWSHSRTARFSYIGQVWDRICTIHYTSPWGIFFCKQPGLPLCTEAQSNPVKTTWFLRHLVYNVRCSVVESSWNVMAHGDAWEGQWRGNWRMEWVASTLHTTSEHGVSSLTTAEAHTSAASSRLKWRSRRFNP